MARGRKTTEFHGRDNQEDGGKVWFPPIKLIAAKETEWLRISIIDVDKEAEITGIFGRRKLDAAVCRQAAEAFIEAADYLDNL